MIETAVLVVAALSCATWLYLALARGLFWAGRENDRVMQARRDAAAPGAAFAWPRIVAIIPARNEADLIGETVGSLLAQRYAGRLSIVVVDDHSDDGTADAARGAAFAAGAPERVTVLSAPPLAPGWTGKLWALAHGAGAVERGIEAGAEVGEAAPEFILFTDADIRYDEDALSALVFSAVAKRSVMSSLMVGLRCESFAERALIPAFVFFFQMLYPFAWVNQAHRRTAAAAGGCVLVRRTALNEAGGLGSIRSSLIDDCALARRLKARGPIELALGGSVRSLRPYPSLHDIRRMVVRTAYAQLRFSLLNTVLVALAMLMVFVAPVLCAIAGSGWTCALGLAAWATMAVLFVPIARRYRVGLAWGLALPAIASAYLAFTLESAIQHLRGRGGLWKGRVNDHLAGSS